MNASVQPISLAEFLAWERLQPQRYEFDGTQPVPTSGGSSAHARLTARLIATIGARLPSPHAVFGSELRVIGDKRMRYPDATIVRADEGEPAKPVFVFEVASAATALTDRRVKTAEYRAIPTLQAYIILSQDFPDITLMRRSADWAEDSTEGYSAVIDLPEIDLKIPLQELYW